jgi:hypothetical protein
MQAKLATDRCADAGDLPEKGSGKRRREEV